MNKRLLFILLLVFALLSCAGREIVTLPTSVDIPVGWPPLSRHVLGIGECPSISGVYAEPPDQWSSSGSHQKGITYERFGYFTMMPFDIAEEGDPANSSYEFGDKEFLIFQVDSDQFSFLIKSINGDVSEHIFVKGQSDYRCENSRVYFPLQTIYRTDQTGSYNLQYQKFLALDEAGDLMMVRITGPYKSSLLGNSPKFEYDFMKFPRVRN